MSKSRPFTYNTGSLIPGTEKFGNLTVGIPESGFESTGLQWWNGPDEDLGYIIASTNVDINGNGLQPTPVGILGNVGFNRTKTWMYSDFVGLVNTRFNQNFVTASVAKTWLESNGKWTSFIDSTENTINNFIDRVKYNGGLVESESSLSSSVIEIGEDLFNQASLVITPNGYEEDLLFSLKPTNGSGDMFVTRATTATRVNEDGLVEEVPYNLFPQSENFNKSRFNYSANVNLTINLPNSPIGTTTVTKYSPTASNNYLCFNSQVRQFPLNTIINMSVYAKNGETSSFDLGGYFANESAIFNLSTGVITPRSANVISYSMENVGNGWYRCNITYKFTNPIGNFYLYAGISRISTSSYNGIDGMFFWGFQVTPSNSVRPYFQTSDRLNVPRIDYRNGQPSILVEPQRTNLLLQSADFTNGWSQEGSSITGNTQISPEGLLTADTIAELATNDVHRTYRTTAIAVTANAIYTVSFFVKKNNVRYVRLILTQQGTTTIWTGAQFDLDTQTFTSQVGTGGGVFSAASITPFVNGWYRISVSGSIPSTSMIPMLALSNGSDMLNTNTRGCPIYLGNTSNSLFIWGAQLEAQLGMTSYIPTTTGAVTRNADVISNLNGFDLIGQTEGTIFVDYNKVLANDGSRNIISLNDGSIANMIEIWDGVGSGNLGRIVYIYYTNSLAKATGFGQPTVSPSGRYKICLTYIITPSLVNFKIFINGVKLDDRNFTYDAFSNPLTRINIGNRNGTGVGVGSHNLDFILKTRITDAQAIQLTTL